MNGNVHNTECNRIESSCTAVLHNYFIDICYQCMFSLEQARLTVIPPSFMVHMLPFSQNIIICISCTDKYIIKLYV